MIHAATSRYWKTILVLTIIALALGCSRRQIYVGTVDSATSIRSDAININAASADDLEKLPGIGRRTAENIVQFRTENGPFRRPEHLMQIRGISEKRFLGLRPYLRTQ
jgi:competence ComEA-like helix-hairpin-helix protein